METLASQMTAEIAQTQKNNLKDAMYFASVGADLRKNAQADLRLFGLGNKKLISSSQLC